MARNRVPALDALRALAVLMVLVFHYSAESDGRMFSPWGRFGWAGVDLFFVLSGYLIGTQLFSPLARGDVFDGRSFFARRLFRTLPNYLFMVFLYFTFESLRERASIAPLWKFLTFTQNWGLNRQTGGAFSHAWSLCVEEQFYLVLPLVALLVWRRARAATVVSGLLALVLAGLFLRVGLWWWVVEPERAMASGFMSFHDQFLYYPTVVHMDGLLVGVGLALMKCFRPGLWERSLESRVACRGGALLFLGLAIVLDELKVSALSSAFLFPVVAIGFGFLLLAAEGARGFFSRPHRLISVLATLSYALYLVQKMVFHAFQRWLPELGVEYFSFAGFALTFAGSVAAASLLYLFIEKPGLRLRDRFLKSGLRRPSREVNLTVAPQRRP